jgi:hypothetical protein
MCYNKEVSLILFIFAVASSISLFLEYQKTLEKKTLFIGVFIIGLSLMQLVEFFIHLYPFNVNPIKHKIASIFIIFAIMVQFLLIEILGVNILPLEILFWLCSFYGLYILYKNYDNTKLFNCTPKCTTDWCRLFWAPQEIIYAENPLVWLTILSVYLIFMSVATKKTFGIKGLSIFLVLLFLSIIVFKNSIGSMWCFSIVLFCILLIIIDKNQALEISEHSVK